MKEKYPVSGFTRAKKPSM